jgi:predicted nucleic-acid-binding Zn-ribbon protein
MSAESDYKCSKCGYEWGAIPPSKCPKCNPSEYESKSVLPTGIEAQVCADIIGRQILGFHKYGVTVADNPLTLKQWLNAAYEEGLDKCIYLKRAIAEIEKNK